MGSPATVEAALLLADVSRSLAGRLDLPTEDASHFLAIAESHEAWARQLTGEAWPAEQGCRLRVVR